MKIFTKLFTGILLSWLLLYNTTGTNTDGPKKEKYDGMRQQLLQDALFRKDPATGRVPVERLLQAKEVSDTKIKRHGTNAAVPGINWVERGPNNVGGRTRVVWFDLNDAPDYKKVWAGGVGGGLWFTNDITAPIPVWNKINDLFDNIAITCFVQDRNNPQQLYFGTGEGWFNGDAQKGLGIWKSQDGGISWARLTNTASFAYVNDLLIDNNGNLYAAVFADGLLSTAVGIQKSTNGGASWTKVLAPFSITEDNSGGDLELAANGDIYTSIGYANNGRIYKSAFGIHGSNTGNTGTWMPITPNTVGAIVPESNLFSDWARIELATAPSNASIVYALFKGISSNDCTSVQQYNASTNSWIVKTVPAIIDQGANSVFTREQGWYNLIAAVDPNNENSLYIGGIDALRSDNAGNSWQQMSTWSLLNSPGFSNNQVVHADHHAILFAPGSSSRAIWGTDGGIYYTANANNTPGKPSFSSRNTGYNVTQYYHCANHPTNPDYFLAGAQDNGSHKFTSPGINSVTEVTSGDGGYTYIDQDNPSIQITSYVYNNYFISTDGGNTFTEKFINDNGLFINVSDYDNTNNILYAADTLRTFLRWKNPEGNGPVERVSVPSFSTNGIITCITISPSIPNRIYVGLLNGQMFAIDNAHEGFEKIAPIQLRPLLAIGTPISSIAVDPSDENHMLITSSSYGGVKIYEARDGIDFTGPYPSWINKEGFLPDIPVNDCLFDPRNPNWVILATDLGIWTCDNINTALPDWQPTNNGLANTRIDHLEYRTTDRTLAAATHGRGLFTAIIPLPANPQVSFEKKLVFAAEETTATTDCRNYKDYQVSVNIGTVPDNNAIITIQVQAGNTAARGTDFDFTTNGNFSTPSNTLIFSTASATSQPITIRIYNDAEVENAEKFMLSYTLSGSSNATPGAGPQTCEVRITDNDRAASGPISTDYIIRTTTFNNEALPFSGQFSDNRTHIIYKRSYLQDAGLSRAGTITAIAFNVTQKNSTAPYTNFSVRLKNTNSFTPISTFQTGSTLVYTGNYSTTLGWNTIAFNTPFNWDGFSDLYVDICYDNNSGTANDLVESSFQVGIGGCGFRIENSGSGCIFTAANNELLAGTVRPNIRLTITEPATPIATILNISRSEYLGPDADVYFYSTTGEVLARIKNLSNHDYGCTQVVIDRAGTGVTQFWSAVSGTQLMNKTIRVIPANNNPTGQYEITLYFTPEEVNGWQTATGQSFSNILLVKTKNPISAVTPANPGGGGESAVVIPIRTNLGVNKSLTYSFTDGFSGFGAGIPGTNPLPIRLLYFTAGLHEDYVRLHWATATENNNKGFIIQKSVDGVRFDSLAFVPGEINSITRKDYFYTDKKPLNEKNYYRLKQVDYDGNESISSVELVLYNCSNCPWFVVLENPVRNNIELRFAKPVTGNTVVRLLDIFGRLVYQQPISTQYVRLPITDKVFSNGMYVIEVISNTRRETKNIVIAK